MLPLLIQIRHTETGRTYDAGFKRSPVRIGRNHLNDLTLDESFVSEWHGIVRFDGESTRFLDVGSTNGTSLAGEPLETNTEVEVEANAELEVGPLRLTLARLPLTSDQFLSRRASAFRLSHGQGTAGHPSAARTMNLGASLEQGLGQAPPADAPDVTTTLADAGVDLDGSESVAQVAQRMATKMKELTALYAKYDAVRVEFEEACKGAIGQATSDLEREGYTSTLSDSCPAALDLPAIRELLPRGEGAEALDAESWLRRLLGAQHSATIGSPEAAMERAGAVLETFASSYVSLMRGHGQVNARIEVSSEGEWSPLQSIDDPRELLRYLLDPSVDPQERLDDLGRAFADIVMHQLGMLNGVVDGAFALMSQVSPQSIGAVAPGAIIKTSAGFSDMLWPFKAAGHYYRYAARHLELTSEDAISKHLFGNAFARAYRRVTGGGSARGGSSIPGQPRR